MSVYVSLFWSSVVLTGDQTAAWTRRTTDSFWSSVVLTGDQTFTYEYADSLLFWSSVVLTGDQTKLETGFSVSSVLEQCRSDW